MNSRTEQQSSAIAFAEELETLIRARYPILYIVTAEETRAQNLLMDIAERRQKRIYEWSCTSGLVPAGIPTQSSKSRNNSTREPMAALEQVVDHVDAAVFVFKDFHPFLNRNHFPIIRKLKEISLQLKNSLNTVVIISPVMEIPVELEKEITVLNFPLPNMGDLGSLLDRIVAEVQELKRVQINLDPEGREQILQAALGLTMNEAESVFAKIIVKRERLSGDDIDEVFWEKRQIIQKSGLLEYCTTTEDFSQVGGLNVLKDWIKKRTVAFSAEARSYGLPLPKGILLLGIQGCGKSLCAKAVASLWKLPLLRFDMGRMFNSLVGSSEENVRKAIAVAESVAPAVLWIDEIDKAFAGSQTSSAADGGTSARVLGTFLTWLSEKTAPVFVVATANDISQLPPELMRKGRLDEIFFVHLPCELEREAIFKIHLAKRGRIPQKFNIQALAETTENFSGAELEQAIISGLYDAFYQGRELQTEDILHAIHQTVPLARTMDEQITRLLAWAKGRARYASDHNPH